MTRAQTGVVGQRGGAVGGLRREVKLAGFEDWLALSGLGGEGGSVGDASQLQAWEPEPWEDGSPQPRQDRSGRNNHKNAIDKTEQVPSAKHSERYGYLLGLQSYKTRSVETPRQC